MSTLRDHNQIVAAEHDEKSDAKRVIIVGGDMPEIKFGDIKLPEVQIQKIEVPVIVKETEIVQVEKQVVIIEHEIVEVQVPVIVKEVQEVIKEVPVIQTKVEIIEKPIIIREVEQRDLPKMLVYAIAAQILVTTIMLLKMILK